MSIETRSVTPESVPEESDFQMPELVTTLDDGTSQITHEGLLMNAVIYRQWLLQDHDESTLARIQEKYGDAPTVVFHRRSRRELEDLKYELGLPEYEEERDEILQAARMELEELNMPYWKNEFRLDLGIDPDSNPPKHLPLLP